MNRQKLNFFKRFSIVIVMYIWFLIIVWFVPEWDLAGKISWTFFLLMLLHFSYSALDLVDRIECCLREDRKLREMENENNI